MTATITPPPNVPKLARADPQVRLNDYCKALENYLTLPESTVDRIVFVENSDSDLTPLREIAASHDSGSRCEFIGFDGNDFPPEWGRAYGEFRLLDHAFATSSHLANATQVWKVTGRLRVANLPRLVTTAPSDYDLYCDLRSVPFIGDRLGGNHWMDMRVFSFTPDFFQRRFENYVPKIKKPRIGNPEKHLFAYVLSLRDEEKIQPRFRVQPRVRGVSAHLDRPYDSPRACVKNILRSAGRRVVPWLWL